MGSTGESDRKRRHISSISPTGVTAKKHTIFSATEDKKIDTAVLQYQNQKLVQQLEAQKAEYVALEGKIFELKEKQQNYDDTLDIVGQNWKELVSDLESLYIRTPDSTYDGCEAACSTEDTFLCRLLDSGATQSYSSELSPHQLEDNFHETCATMKKIIHNLVLSIDAVRQENDLLPEILTKILPENDSSVELRQSTRDLQIEVNKLRISLDELHLKHRSLVHKVQRHQDVRAKNKSELIRLQGELEDTFAELKESNEKVTMFKAQKDAAPGSFPVLSVGCNKNLVADKVRDRQKNGQDLELELKDFMELASDRLQELKNSQKERIILLKQLATMQNDLMSINYISSSKAYLFLHQQLENSKAELDRHQALLEKLQTEKENFLLREKEMSIKIDLADIFRRTSTVTESQIGELEKEFKKQINERHCLELKLEESAREPGRKQVISEFETMASSFSKSMGIMQSQLTQYKEAASDVHSLRAEVQSISNILQRKINELEILSTRSVDQLAEIQKLQSMVHDLAESNQELQLFLEMYRRESTDSRDVMESRESEFKAWAHVQGLKSLLDERCLELRVKEANEAEAISQQRLATSEAEISELRQKLEDSRRVIVKLSETLKSKHEENEAYLSEIETIGQAYEDMQTQNQQLLQQITERDDYNIKLVLEGMKAGQQLDTLRMETSSMEMEMRQAGASVDIYSLKAARIEEQSKLFWEQVERLVEDEHQSSVSLENAKTKLLGMQVESQKLKQFMEESQPKFQKSRLDVTELQIDLEDERFNKRRLEEELEVVTRKVEYLTAKVEGSSVLQKLRQEVKEYKEILRCGICRERQKEVVITKCYHLFCYTCVQKTLENRNRRCPSCNGIFMPNDVKKFYI